MARLSDTSLISDANLKAYYKLDSGALTTDSSSGGFTLTNSNTVGEGVGKYDGAADYGTANTNKMLYVNNDLGIGGGAITLSCWVKLRSEIASDASTWMMVMQNDTGVDVSQWINYEYNGGTRRIQFFRTRQGVSFDGPTYNVTLGTSNWRHLVYTYDGTNVRGYVDGVLVAGPTACSGSGSGAQSDFFSIGADRAAGSGQSFASAYIDEVAVFNRALSDIEISQLYNETATSTLSESYSFFM